MQAIKVKSSPSRIPCASNKENKEKFFNQLIFSETLDNIFIKKNKIGIPAPKASEFFDSLHKHEKKKQILLVAQKVNIAHKFNSKKADISNSPLKTISLKPIPLTVTSIRSIVILSNI